MIGIFSYNEVENLRRIYDQIKKQYNGLSCWNVYRILRQSDEPERGVIVNEIIKNDSILKLTVGA